jgi:capsular exopolysaccharide synthesis family protein
MTLLERGRAADPKPDLAEELVSLLAPSSLEADLYRTLRQSVERMHRESGLKVLAMTSATPGDGKTLTCLNLAGALAQTRGSRVLVVDADLHQPAVAEYLGLPPPFTMGLVDLIDNDKYSLAQATIRLESLNLSVLPAGETEEAFGLLASTRVDALMAEARRSYDFVIVDSPPVAPLSDCRLIERCVDGFALVVAAHKTPRKFLGEAVEALNLIDPQKILGVVFNGDDRPLTPYYGYYYGKGRKHRRVPTHKRR